MNKTQLLSDTEKPMYFQEKSQILETGISYLVQQ